MNSKQAGFTLIELVVVMAILGILAATALPRYVALQNQARVAKLNGALGAAKGAAALTHGACLATITPVACTPLPFTLTMEGLGVPLLNQYPTADAAGIIAAAGITLTTSEGFETTGGGATAGATLTVRVIGNDPSNCSFTYTAPAGPNLSPVFGPLLTLGC